MECPTCGGECYDNREKVAGGWKGPLWKCRDTACAWTKWPPKGQKGGGGNREPQATGNGTERVKRPLGRLYFECMKIAAGSVKQVLGDKATAADVIAATATVFIAATQTGAPLVAPKAPPPPKPKPPEPEPEPEYHGENYDDTDLPF